MDFMQYYMKFNAIQSLYAILNAFYISSPLVNTWCEVRGMRCIKEITYGLMQLNLIIII